MEVHAQYETAVNRWTDAVVARIERRVGIQIDPEFWQFLKDLIMQLLPLLIGCFAGAGEAVQGLKKLNRWQRFRINLALSIRTPEEYQDVRRDIGDAIVEVAGTTTNEEMEATFSVLKS